MNSKEYLTNRAFCPMPWTGIMYNFDGTVKNCIRSAGPIGNINNNSIEEILSNDNIIKADYIAQLEKGLESSIAMNKAQAERQEK